MERKLWTYEEARKILPVIREITEEYYSHVSELSVQLREKILPENEMENKEEEVRDLILEWSSNILKYGIEVKGLWLRRQWKRVLLLASRRRGPSLRTRLRRGFCR
ncbi:PF09969 family protein [Leptospira santarosai str. HAI134]|nr:PF09969 family protein [Leptospira santarosai str. HAI134]